MADSNQNPTKPGSYIDQLQFKQKFHNSFIGKYFANIRIAILLIITLVATGVFSLSTLSKTLYPTVDIPAFYISTVLPGGSPEDMETIVTDPLEQEIKKIKGIDEYNSVSQENVSLISIQFVSGTNANQAQTELQEAVDLVAGELPTDAQNPDLMQVDFENTPVWVFALAKTNNTTDTASLMRMATDVKDDLEELPSISRIEMSGFDEREVRIMIKPEFVKEHNIDPHHLSTTIQNALDSYPAGTVTNTRAEFSVSINPSLTSVNDLRNLLITFEDQQYQLSEIAEVAETSALNQPHSYIASTEFDAKQIVVFYVYKTTESELETTFTTAHSVVDQTLSSHSDYFQTYTVANYSDLVDEQINDLMGNLYQTLALVFLSMLLLYGIRQSLIAAVSIPLAICLVLGSMHLFGFTINFISIYSLLIALGLFTDNAVVIIEGFTSIYKSGRFSPKEAALLTFKDYSLELFVINLLTCWSFLPMLTMPGMMGEFVKPLPILVSVAMMASVFVALFLTLPSMMVILDFKPPKRVKVALLTLAISVILGGVYYLIPHSSLSFIALGITCISLLTIYTFKTAIISDLKKLLNQVPQAHRAASFFTRALDAGFISLDELGVRYHQLIGDILEKPARRRQIIIGVILIGLFSFILLPLGFVKSEFFPQSEGDTVYVQLTLPQGTAQEQTQQVTLQLLQELRQKQYAEHVTAEIQAQHSSGLSLSQATDDEVLFTLFLKDRGERKLDSFEITEILRKELKNKSSGDIAVLADDSNSPPAGADIELVIIGDDINKLKELSTIVETYLQQQPGIASTQTNADEGTSKLTFVPDPAQLSHYNLDQATIGYWLRIMLSGVPVDTLQINDQDYKIVITMNENVISPEELSSLEIGVKGTGYIPLNQLGEFVMEPNPSLISRKNGQRAVTITSSVKPGYNSTSINTDAVAYMDTLNFPQGYSWELGGSQEINNQATESLIIAMGISFILLTLTLVLQLQSFRQAGIVLAAIPIAVSGVFITFALLGITLSLPAMMGILSLFGIVIANSLMIVDKINRNLDINFEFRHAITDAASSRLEPILLTSAAQIVGLIPTFIADEMWRGFGGAIIFGLGYSAVVMLFFIPVVYFELMKER